MNVNDKVDACWHQFTRALGNEAALTCIFAFGEDDEPELAELVAQGVKTATSGIYRWYEESGERPAAVGDLHIVTMADGTPRCVIETTEVAIRRFDQIDEQFAADYGEGERTLHWWRANLGRYYAELCPNHGWEWSDSTLLFCHRFRVVFQCGHEGSQVDHSN